MKCTEAQVSTAGQVFPFWCWIAGHSAYLQNTREKALIGRVGVPAGTALL